MGEDSLCRRNPPPHRSRPEAAHFPTQLYTFESHKKPFQAPPEYPQPPRDLWYQIPETAPAPESAPTPIFPWEKGPARPTATRVFSDDPPSPVQASIVPTRWEDSSGGMERYIRNIMSSATPAQQSQAESRPAAAAVERPESLVFSGFPAVGDRPSLPVTPAPIMTNTFWGDRGDDEAGVAGAGAFKKAEWVCPNCGFLSTDPAVFIPSHAEPAGPAVAPAPSSPPAAADAASPPQPQPQGEPEASATAVSSPPTALPEAEPAVAVAAAPPPQPLPPPAQPLPPPAWLTAAVVDADDAVDDVDMDDSQPSDPSRQN
jgi:glycogenin glucosyltransferase